MNQRLKNFAHKISSTIDARAWRSICRNAATQQKVSSTTYGAFVYSGSTNLGDDFQTIAARCHIPSENVLPVDRENLNSFYSEQKVKVLFNGWFTHRTDNWPPSNSIEPVFLGFHAARKEIVNERHAAYFKSIQPIGCRDHNTVSMLRDIGVAAFFSGCPTLTLPPSRRPRSGEILVVDAHLPNPDGHTSDTTKLLSKVVPQSVLGRAVFLTQNVSRKLGHRHGKKLQLAYNRLERYSCAQLVITNRLHVALPCLAYSTPCLFLHCNPENDARLNSYYQLLNFVSNSDSNVTGSLEQLSAMPLPRFAGELKSQIKQRLAATS